MFNRWGGLGAAFIRTIRRLGFDDQGIWSLGRATRWLFLVSAAFWERVPHSIRRVSPLQLIRFHSVRLHHWRLAERGYPGLSGVMREGKLFVVELDHPVEFARASTQSSFVAFMTKPQGRKMSWRAGARTVVSGGHDSTFPAQWDIRYAQPDDSEVDDLIQGIKSSGVVRWYAENLTSYDPIFSPIPGGILPSPWRDSVRLVRSRPRKVAIERLVFCAHRDKGGQRANPQFDVRRKVTALAEGPWREFTTIPDDYLSIAEFRRQLLAHPFTLCVEGGGIDPSPKAFEALLQGSIPIIRESPLADAYRHFPVLVVPEWDSEALSPEMLANELVKVRERWPDWYEVVGRMSLSYWLRIIEAGRDTRTN